MICKKTAFFSETLELKLHTLLWLDKVNMVFKTQP